MAISSNTPTRLMLDAGDLFVNSTDVGATKSGGSFVVEQDIYFPELAGAKGALAGTGTVVKESATLAITLVEITMANLIIAIPTLASASDATSEYTTTPDVGPIGSASHVTVIWQGHTTNVKHVQLILYNALAEGGLTLNLEDGAETAYEITFRSYTGVGNPKGRNWKMSLER
jgi:hypothetical protein